MAGKRSPREMHPPWYDHCTLIHHFLQPLRGSICSNGCIAQNRIIKHIQACTNMTARTLCRQPLRCARRSRNTRGADANSGMPGSISYSWVLTCVRVQSWVQRVGRPGTMVLLQRAPVFEDASCALIHTCTHMFPPLRQQHAPGAGSCPRAGAHVFPGVQPPACAPLAPAPAWPP